MGGPGEQGLGAYFPGISSLHFPVGLGVGEEGTRALEEGMIGEPWEAARGLGLRVGGGCRGPPPPTAPRSASAHL